MKTSFAWVSATVLVSAFGFACSEDEGRPREEGVGGSSTPMGTAASSGSGAAGGSVSTTGGSSGAGGTNQVDVALGDPLIFETGTGLVPYSIGPNEYGIRGGGFLARSISGNTITVGDTPGELCISGNLEEVPGGNYSQYWGVEIGFNLNQGPAAGDVGLVPNPPEALTDAGADAAVSDAAPPMEVAQPWIPGDVIGFSFVIEGPTINLIRFKSLPAGFDSALESSVYCNEIRATSGAVQSVLFTEMAQYCWNATANVFIPTGAGLDNISWQLPADVAPAGQRPFDFCIKDLRPILAR